MQTCGSASGALRWCLSVAAGAEPGLVRDAVLVAAIVLLGAGFLLLGLLIVAVVLAVRRSWSRLRATVVGAVSLVIMYAAALVTVSVATPPSSMAIGQWKCFDDWCASVTSLTRTGDAVVVTLSVQNRGRREQAPDTPRAWFVHDGRRDQLAVPGLASRVPGGAVQALPQIRLMAPRSESPMLVITEGGFPSRLVIGDDNSPFHPQAGWPLT